MLTHLSKFKNLIHHWIALEVIKQHFGPNALQFLTMALYKKKHISLCCILFSIFIKFN